MKRWHLYVFTSGIQKYVWICLCDTEESEVFYFAVFEVGFHKKQCVHRVYTERAQFGEFMNAAVPFK